MPIWDGAWAVLLTGTIGKNDTTPRTIRYDSSIYSGTVTLNVWSNTSYFGSNVFTIVYKNGTEVARYSTTNMSGNPHTITGITMVQWDVIGVAISNGSWGNNQFNITVASGTIAIPGSSKAPAMKVSEIFSIWDLFDHGGSTFGNFNGEFYIWDDTITSVDIGNITLPNAIWYIKIGKYKIPYYL